MSQGYEAHFIDEPRELHSLEPLLRGGLVRAAEYTPLSGHVNPRSCVRCDPHTFALSLSRVLTD